VFININLLLVFWLRCWLVASGAYSMGTGWIVKLFSNRYSSYSFSPIVMKVGTRHLCANTKETVEQILEYVLAILSVCTSQLRYKTTPCFIFNFFTLWCGSLSLIILVFLHQKLWQNSDRITTAEVLHMGWI